MVGSAGDDVGVLLDSLTEDERKHLFEFCDATAMDDLDAAIGILQAKQWHVGQAIQAFFEPPPPTSDNNNGNNSNNATHTDSASGTSGLRHRTAAATTTSERSQTRNDDALQSARRLEPGSSLPAFTLVPLVAWPFMLLVQLALFFIRGFLTLIGLGRIAAAGIPGADNTTTALADTHGGSAGDAARLHSYFESTYGNTHPPFFVGTYTGALEAAHRDMKYLVVVLWSRAHDDADRLGQALTHSRVVEFLSNPRYIVWMGDVSCTEAYGAAARLGVTAYPFVGLAALKPAPQTSGGSNNNNRFRLHVVARIEGLSGSANADNADALARELTRRLGVSVEANEQALQAAQREQEARDSDRRLREQQNAAYEASLARDRERERLVREREQSEHTQRAEEERRQREREGWEKRREQWRWATLARIMREDSNSEVDVMASKKKPMGRFQLRLEDGTRLVRAFAADATMQHVFDFIETRGVAEKWGSLKTTPHGDDLDAIRFPEEYTHEYDFALVSQFPRVVFDHTGAALGEVMAANGLWPSATLIVEPLFEPEDEASCESTVN
ncbi:Ubx domain-containing protein [Coemansia sp. IMI 209127]|nr:Ubx domain-containing protein [Coemansia sp. IMI 209127]